MKLALQKKMKSQTQEPEEKTAPNAYNIHDSQCSPQQGNSTVQDVSHQVQTVHINLLNITIQMIIYGNLIIITNETNIAFH